MLLLIILWCDSRIGIVELWGLRFDGIEGDEDVADENMMAEKVEGKYCD